MSVGSRTADSVRLGTVDSSVPLLSPMIAQKKAQDLILFRILFENDL